MTTTKLKFRIKEPNSGSLAAPIGAIGSFIDPETGDRMYILSGDEALSQDRAAMDQAINDCVAFMGNLPDSAVTRFHQPQQPAVTYANTRLPNSESKKKDSNK